jgi:pimeloyl-ACP methyl ester carboxylesterase
MFTTLAQTAQPFRALACAAITLIAAACATTPQLQPTKRQRGSMTTETTKPNKTGYANVNGLKLYYEVRGQGGTPLIVLHGGLHNTQLDAPVAARLAEHRQVISIDLQAHGRTADIERPLRFELLANDIGGLLTELGLARVDVLGYSLGGTVALQLAIQHPESVRKLVLVSIPFSKSGWYPEVNAGFEHLNHALADMMKPSPVYQSYAAIAPHAEQFPKLLDKVGELERRDFDWSSEIGKLSAPTLLLYADADAIAPAHCVRFYELLGGGKRDGGLDGSGAPVSRLAILPGLTHYNLFESPAMIATVEPFLDAR